MKVLVTGGAGYIGSHTIRLLVARGFEPVALDNLSEGHREAVQEASLVEGDLADEAGLDALFERERFEGVLHFAARCTVAESMQRPRLYYEQNVGNSLTLLRVMLRHGVRRLIFSSTCAVYGIPDRVPIPESHPCLPVNPYGQSKRFVEQVLEHYARAYGLNCVSLRYFNAAGAGPEGGIGEAHDPETHLIPLVLKAAGGTGEPVRVFGTDYPTEDGTCIRDYVHVTDLAAAHVLALEHLGRGGENGCFNLGTGTGCSVLQVLAAARRVCGRPIEKVQCPRREGDPPRLVAQAERAGRVLGWEPRHSDLETIIATAWQWEQNRRY